MFRTLLKERRGEEAKPIARDVTAFVTVKYYVVKIHGDFVIIFVFASTLSTLLCCADLLGRGDVQAIN